MYVFIYNKQKQFNASLYFHKQFELHIQHQRKMFGASLTDKLSHSDWLSLAVCRLCVAYCCCLFSYFNVKCQLTDKM